MRRPAGARWPPQSSTASGTLRTKYAAAALRVRADDDALAVPSPAERALMRGWLDRAS
ncbi:hypothetical protein [Mycobacterium helveticum]|uniref:hypothetical protein n=1 Tax=Mycobacterium helveticum TaxID=2592811 RepID=UPI00143D4D35|nr:hypothetical protein [Mycobacterium helveticum]